MTGVRPYFPQREKDMMMMMMMTGMINYFKIILKLNISFVLSLRPLWKTFSEICML